MLTLQPHNPERWYKWFLAACLVAMALILCNCDCNYHLKQAKKKCGQSFLSDTTYIHDTTLIKSVQKDTTFFYKQKDTTIIREGRLVMKYFYNSHDSTIYLSGKCDTIFITKNIPQIINTTELKPDMFDKYKWWIVGLLLILLIFALLRK